jgi:DNA repair exonuclease SbcCD ATPase subunit
MDLVIRRDIRQLVLDVRKIRRELDRLKQDQKAWARDRQQDDLSGVIDRLKRLEFDVSVIQADCVSIGRIHREDGARRVMDSLHRAFKTLNTLFNDIKNMRTELKEAYICSVDVKQLEIDWSRFTKTVSQIERYLQDGDNLMKTEGFFLSEGGGTDGCCSTIC